MPQRGLKQGKISRSQHNGIVTVFHPWIYRRWNEGLGNRKAFYKGWLAFSVWPFDWEVYPRERLTLAPTYYLFPKRCCRTRQMCFISSSRVWACHQCTWTGIDWASHSMSFTRAWNTAVELVYPKSITKLSKCWKPSFIHLPVWGDFTGQDWWSSESCEGAWRIHPGEQYLFFS